MSVAKPYVSRGGNIGPNRFHSWQWIKPGIWWREIDRVLLGLVVFLMVIGAVAVFSASPASAQRLSSDEVQLPDLYFYWIHLRWQLLGLVVLLVTSLLPREEARRFGILLAAAMIFFLLLVPMIGHHVNGAKRALNFGILFQPSEFLKPGFAIFIAWILSWRLHDSDYPILRVSGGIMLLVGVLLMLQPNFGATVLFCGVWFVLVVLSGVPLHKLGMLMAGGVMLVVAAYFLYDNAGSRIDAFFGGGTAFDQVDLAQRTLLAGGWIGSGIWLGVRKNALPEAHTDYIFSVIGEEFGLIACAIIIAVYLAIVIRVLKRLSREDNLFVLLAGTGLVTQIGGQAFINILVNLQIFPSKGMTLPLVSYGGSSTIAVCLAVGLLLAITRRNPYLTQDSPGLQMIFENQIATVDGDGRRRKRL